LYFNGDMFQINCHRKQKGKRIGLGFDNKDIAENCKTSGGQRKTKWIKPIFYPTAEEIELVREDFKAEHYQ
jgi:hypothetical protein